MQGENNKTTKEQEKHSHARRRWRHIIIGGRRALCPPSLGITSVFVPQPPVKMAEGLMGLRATFLSGCWGSQVGKPSASLRHNKEMKLLQGHADLMKAGFGFPCTLKEDTVPYLCARLSEVCSRQETSVPISSFAHCQTAGYISWSTRAKSERSFPSETAPSCITHEKMPLFPIIPLAPRI